MNNKLRFLALFVLFITVLKSHAQQVPASTRAAGICSTCAPDGWTPGSGTPDVSNGTVAATTATAGGGANWTSASGGNTNMTLPAPPNGHVNWITIRDVGTVAGEEDIFTTMTGLVVGREYEVTIYSLTAVTRENGGTGGNVPYAGTYIDQFNFVVGTLPRVAVTNVSRNVWGTNKLRFTATTPSMQLRFYPGFNSPANGSTALAGMRLMECVNISVTLDAINTIPVAEDKNTSTPMGIPVDIDVIDGAIDYDGNIVPGSVDLDPDSSAPGRQTSITNADGTWTVNSSGVVTFTPAPGFSGEATLTYTVEDDYTLDGVSAPGISTPKTLTVFVENPSLSLVKEAVVSGLGSPIVAGDVITYSFIVSNTGNVTVANIVVNDPLLGGVVDNSAGTWPVTEGVLAPGQYVELSVTYEVTTENLIAGTVENTATVSAADPVYPLGPVPSNPVTVHLPQVDDCAGDQTVYRLDAAATIAANPVINGSGGTINVVFSRVSGTAIPGIGDSFTRTLTYSGLDGGREWQGLAVVGGRLVLLPLATDGPGGIYANLPPNNLDDFIADLGQVDESFYEAIREGELDELGHFVITLGDLSDLTLPTGVSIVNKYATVGTVGNGTYAAGQINNGYWMKLMGQGEVVRGGDGSSTPDAVVPWGASLPYRYSAFDDGTEPIAGNGGTRGWEITSDIVFCTVTPALSIVKSTDFTGTAKVNDVIGYELTVINDGNVTIENIEVNDPRLGGVVSNTALAPGAAWPVTVGTLAPGESVTLSGFYTVLEADAIAGEVENTATVSGDDPVNPGSELTPVSSNTVHIIVYDPCVITATNPDSDGDGVADGCDLDDDNDGILDTEENACLDAVLAGYPGSMPIITPSDFGISFNGSAQSNLNLTADISDKFGYPVGAGAVIVSIHNAHIHPTADAFFIRGDQPVTEWEVSGNLASVVGIEQGIQYYPGHRREITLKTGEAQVSNASPATPGVWESGVIGNTYFVENVSAGFRDDGVLFVGLLDYAVKRFELSTDESGPDRWSTYFVRLHPECDADMDGIPNRLDADSDNDGCPDAVEYYGDLDALGTDGGYYGEGTPPAVDAEGRVVAAPYVGTYANAVAATQLTIASSPVDASANVGSAAVLEVEALATQTITFNNGTPEYAIPPAIDASSDLLYQWQVSTDGGATWNNLSDDSQYDGTGGAQLTVNDVTLGLHEYQYRVEVSHSMHVCPILSASAILTVLRADLEIEKEVDYTAPDIGTQVTFTITVTNNGPDAATGVVIADQLPSGYSHVSNTGSGAYDVATGIWTVGDLAVDAVSVLSIVATVNEVGDYTNTAIVSANEYDPEPTNNESAVTLNPVAAPSIQLVKTADLSGPVSVDDVITYTFVVTNTGNVTLTGIDLDDHTFNGTGTAPVLSAPTASAGSSATSLLPGGTLTYTATYTVVQGDIDAGVALSNQATVTGTPPSGADVTDDSGTTGTTDDPTEVPVVTSAPSIELVKTADLSGPVSVDDEITYTFVVTNTGNVTLTGIDLDDHTFSGTGTAPVLSAPAASAGSSTASLLPGGTLTYTATYTVVQGDIDAGVALSNQATVTGTPPSGADVTDDSGTTGTTDDPTEVPVVTSAPSIELVKTADLSGPVSVDDEITYTFVVTNTGNVTLTGIDLDDHTFSGTGTAPVLSAPAASAGSSATSLLPGGTLTYTATYTVVQTDIDAGVALSNQATVTGTPPSGADVTDDSGTTGTTDDPTEVPVVPAAPSIQLVKTADPSGPVSVDDEITYTFVVTNTGNVTLTGIDLDDHTFNGTGTAPVLSAPAASAGSSATSLLPGGTLTYTATYTVVQGDIDAGVALSNQATVTGTPPSGADVTDDSGTTGTTDDPTEVPVVPAAPSIELVKTADLSGPVSVDDEITYTFVVTNTGNVTLTGIDLDDHTFNGTGTAPVLSAPTASAGSSVASLLPGGTLTYTATYTVVQTDIDAGVALSNQATVTGTPPSGADVTDESGTTGTTDDPTEVPVVPAAPSIELVKTASPSGPVSVDDDITYTFVVTNTGNVTLTGIDLDDHTFSGTGTAPVLSAPTASAGSSATSLLPGGTLTYTATYTVVQGDIDAGVALSNQATVTGTPPSGADVTDDSGTTGTTDDPTEVPVVTSNPAIALVKTAALTTDNGTTGVADLGDVIEYTFVVTNTGNVTLTGIDLDDHTFSGTGTAPVLSAPTASAGSSATSLLPGGTLTYTATYTVVQGDIDAGVALSNQATVTGTPPSGADVTDDSGTTGTTDDPTEVPVVPAAPSIELVKTASPSGPVSVDDLITYTFVVTNTGNVTLTGIDLDDHTFSGTGTAPVLSAPAASAGSSTASLLPGGTLTYTATYTVVQGDIDAGVALSNQATVTGTPPSGADVTDESGTTGTTDDPTQVPVVPAAPSIQLVKTASPSGPVSVDDDITYTFVVTNTGNVTLTDIDLDDHTFSGTGTAPVLSAPAASAGSSTASLLPGGTLTYTATYTVVQTDVDAGVALSNQATVTGTPPSGADVTDESGTTGTTDNPTEVPVVTSAPSIELVKTASPSGPVSVDDGITYTFVVTNTGNVTLTGIDLNDHTFNGTGTAPVLSAPAASAGSSAASLLPGGTLTYTATYTVVQTDIDAGVALSNQATVTGTPPSGADVTDDSGTTGTTDDPTEVPVVPAAPSIELVKTASPSGPVSVDDGITYTFVVTNTGNVTLTDIDLDDHTFSGTGTAPVLSAPAASAGSSTASLLPGGTLTYTATYTVVQTDIDAGVALSNQATVTGTPPSGADVTDESGTTGTTDNPTEVPVVPAAPSIQLVKTASPSGPVSVDDGITYTFVVTNTGNVTLTDIDLDDHTFSGTGTAPVLSAPTASAGSSATSLLPGGTLTYTATYTVVQGDIDAGVALSNQATVTGTPPSGADVTDESGTTGTTDNPTEVPVVTSAPSIELVKTASPSGPVSVDDGITYTFVVTNTGNVTLTGINLNDHTFSGTGTAPVLSAPAASAGSSAASLLPGGTLTYTATYTVVQTDIDAGVALSNQATVTGTPPSGADVTDDSGTTGTTDDPTEVPVVPAAPSIELVKTASPSGPVSVDDGITYTFVVTNTGNVTLTGINLNDHTFSGTGTAPVLSAPAASAGSSATSLLPGGTLTYTATYTVVQGDIDAGVALSNQATVTGTPPSGADVTDESGTTGTTDDPTEVPVVTSAPSIELVKTASPSGPVSVDDGITYTFVVTNTGNVTLTGIDLDDHTFSGTGTAPVLSAPAASAGSSTASLLPGGTLTYTATYTVVQTDVDAGVALSNQATVTGTPPSGADVTDDSGTTGTTDDPTQVTVGDPSPGLSLTKRVTNDAPYVLDSYINFEIVITNTGNVTLTDVTVSDDNAEIISGSPVATLAPNASATVIARHLVTQTDIDAGVVVNQAKVTGEDPEGNPIPEVPSDNPDTPQPNDPTVVELAQQPALTLTKRATSNAPYAVGQYITFEIVARNTGNVTLTNVTVTDDNAEIISGSPVATLAPNASATVIARHLVTQADIDAGVVVNQAKVTGDDPEGNPIPEVPSDNPDTPQPNDPTVVELAQNPALTLTKKITTGAPYAVGQYITYEIVARNTGNVTLTNVVVTDDNAVIVSGSPVATLAPNASATVIARHQVTQADIDAGVVVNQAKVTGDDPEGNPIPEVPSDNPDTPQPNDPTVAELAQNPALTLTKKVTTGAPYTVGQYITFEIVARNTGNVTLTNVVVTDPNAVIISGSPIASLAPNASATVIARHLVTQTDIDAGVVVNQAKVTGEDPEGNPIPEVPSDNPDTPQPNDPTVVELAQNPALTLTKKVTTGAPYTVGQYITFEIVARNTGNVTLTNVTVTDDNAEIISGSPVATLAPNASATVIARHQVTQTDIDAGVVVNQAKVTGDDPEGNPIPEVPSDNPDTPQPNDPTVVELAQQPALTLTKRATSNAPYAVGQYITFEIVARNTGNVTLTNVTVTDDNAEIISGSPIASLAPNASATVIARHQVTQTDIDAGVVVNQAKVTGNDPEGNPIPEVPSDNPDTPQPNDPTVVELTQQPALTLTKRATSNAPYAVGQYITFEIVARNTGNVTLTNVTVTDDNAEIISGSPVATLAPNASATVIARHLVTQADIDAGVVVNQAKVTGDDPEGNPIPEVPSDNPDTPQPNDPTVVELAQNPALTLTKRATSNAPYAVGQYITFEIVARNTGNVTLTNVVVTDDNAVILSGSPIASLAPNASATVIARHLVTQADIDAGVVVNQAKVTGDDPEGNPIPEVPSDNPDTPQPNDPTVVELAQNPALTLTKKVTTGAPYTVGQYITFEIVARNTGNVTLTNVTVTDDNAEIISGSPVATLAPNASATVIARHQVTQADIDAGVVVNQAKVTGDDPEGNPIPEVPSDNPDTPQPNDPTVVELAQNPALTLTKKVTTGAPYTVGQYITFEIVARNTGNVTLTNVTVTDDNAEIISGSPVATLAPNASATVIARHQVTQTDIDAGVVVNQAKVTGNDPEGNPIPEVPSDNPDTPQPNDPTVVELAQQPALTLTKRATSNAPYAVGQYITFEIVARNTGNVTLTNVTVTDDNADIVSGSPIASLAPNTTATVIARHQVTQTDIDAGVVVNQAKVTGNDPEGNPIPEVPSDNPDTPQPNDPTVVELAQQPALTLTKKVTTGAPYTVGQYITFEIVARNTGNVTLTNVTITDDNAVIVSGSPVATLAPNASATVIARHLVTQTDIDAGVVVNQAKVTGDDPEGNPIPEVPSDNPDTPQPNDPTVVELAQNPALTLTKKVTTGAPYTVGQYITFEIVARNTGNVTLTNVTVTDDNAVILSGSPVATLAPNASATVIARHQVTQADIDAGVVVNQAKVTGDDPEGNPIPEVPSDNPDTPQPNDPTVVELAQQPALTLTKRATSNAPYAVGQYITFEIVARNTGNVTLTNVTVTDDNAVIISGSPIASLAPNASATVIARHQVTQADIDAGVVVNQAKVTGDDPEGNPIPEVPSDNPDTPQPNDPTVVELAQNPALTLTKRATTSAPYAVGQYITFEIVARNTGNVTLTNVTVMDDNAVIVSGSPVATLAPNASATVIARHLVTQADIDAGVVVNQAKVTGNDPEGNPIPEVPSDNPDTPQPNDPTVVELAQNPALTLTKKVTTGAPYTVGQYITFEIVARNTGNVTLTNVVVTDDNADIVSGSPVATLAPNASATVIARHQVTQQDIDAGVVVNQAKVTGNDPEGNPIPEVPSDNPDTPQPNDPTVVELTQSATLSLSKRVTGEGPYIVGQYVNYEIVVRNTGNVTLTGVAITDDNAVILSGSPIASLAPNASATVIARHLVTQADIDAGTVINQAKVTGDDPEGNPIPEVPSDNPDTPQPNDPTVVEFESKPGLSLFKGVTSEGPYDVGDHIKYFNIVVTNTGNVTLTDVTVTDDNAEIISGSPIARLKPGESTVVMARHVVTQEDVDAGEVVNQAKATGKDPEGNLIPEVPSDDPNTPEEGDETITPIAQTPGIRIDKRADRSLVERVGERITYQLQVVNTGNVTLRDVVVTDPLTGFEQRIAVIRPGIANAHTFQTRYTVTPADLEAGKVTNTATVSANDPDGNPVNHRSTIEVPTYFKIIEAADDGFGPVNGRDGGATGNVFANDKADGEPIDPTEVTLTRLPAEGPSPLTLEADGTVTVAPNTPAGTYTLDYQLCDIINPANCDVATVTVIVAPPPIEAEDDVVRGVNGYTGKDGATNVFANDRLNGQPVVPAEVTLTEIAIDPGLRLNPDGSVDVLPGTPAGSYTVEYRICEQLNPDNCSTAAVTVEVVAAPIAAENDNVTGVNGYSGTQGVTNVFTNDRLNGQPVKPDEVTLTLVRGDDALRLNPDGSVDVLPGTRGGTYTLEYRICEQLNPTNCSAATVTVTVVNPLKIPNVFTPNGDGNNDRFEIIGIEGFDRISVVVVNRWGNEVYRHENYRNDWDGGALNEGMYYYVIVTHRGTVQERHTGWVLIKRQ